MAKDYGFVWILFSPHKKGLNLKVIDFLFYTPENATVSPKGDCH